MALLKFGSSILRDISFPAVVAGFVAVLVGFTSSVALIFQAARSLGATPGQTASWLLALGIGIGFSTILLSIRFRLPVLIAWSTPGAAVIAGAASVGELTLAQATGAFLVSAALIAITGISGGFEKIMHRLPLPLASALLAGVLSKFTLDAFAATPGNPLLLLTMFAVYLTGRAFWPKFHVPVMLVAGIVVARFQGLFHLESVSWSITTPVFVMPEFTVASIIGVAIPLFVVTMASQNLPGVSVFLAHGYEPPVSKILTWSGLANLVVAPFGGFSLNLAAITAAFCMNGEANPDPGKRYVSAVFAGLFYLLIGIFGATLAALFFAFPHELILAIAGLALLGTIATGLTAALKEDGFREAAVVTYFVTLSGIVLVGVGSAFWGIVAGELVLLMKHLATKRTGNLSRRP